MHNPAIPVPTPVPTPAPPPGVLAADHFVQPLGYFARRPSGTRDWVITYTQSGAGHFRLGTDGYICRAGDVVILPPGTPHDYGTDQSVALWDFYWAHFSPRAAWLEWLKLEEALPGILRQSIADLAVAQRVVLAFERVLRDNVSGANVPLTQSTSNLSHWQKELAENALEEVLLLVAQQHAQQSAPPMDTRISLALQYMAQHLREPLSVEGLARLAGLSPSRLAHLFKQQVGASIIDTLLALRLKQAARLLRFSSLNVQQVATEVGFQSAFYFSRQFKTFFALSPSDYRRQHQALDMGG